MHVLVSLEAFYIDMAVIVKPEVNCFVGFFWLF